MGKRGAGRKRRGGKGRGAGRKRDGGSNRRRSGGRGHGGRGDEFFAGLPLGPETVRELSDWGPHVIRGLQRGKDGEDDGSALYLAGTWQRMTWRTDYSGFDCPRWAMEIGLAALQSEYGIAGSCVWEFVRSCDIGSLQTKFLTHIARQETPSPCHFGAIQKRLHAQAQRFISAAMPMTMMDRQRNNGHTTKSVSGFLLIARGLILRSLCVSASSMRRNAPPTRRL